MEIDDQNQSEAFGRDDVEVWAKQWGVTGPITEAHMALVSAVAYKCAEIAAKYQMGSVNAGDEIRAKFGLG